MAKGQLVVTVTSETLEVTEGHWCATCLLPAVCQIVVAVLFDAKPHDVRTWWECRDCGRSGWRRR